MMRISLLLVALFFVQFAKGQNVGVGTLFPKYKLDVQTRYDTTLQIKNVGQANVPTALNTRLGILNIIDNLSAGSRTGMSTQISFPNTAGAHDQYVGHDIAFDGFCFPIGSGCDSSDIYGIKIDVPPLANDGVHYGVYANVPRLSGYAGHFIGRGYFSQMVGIGTDPNSSQQLYVLGNSTTLNPMTRAVRVLMNSVETTNSLQSMLISGTLRSSDRNIGSWFSTVGYDGETYGILSSVNGREGAPSYGISAENTSSQGLRYGIKSDVTGDANSLVFGISSQITGSSGSSAAYGFHSFITSGTTTNGASYGVFSLNADGGHAGYFSGRVQVLSGTDANYNNTSGQLILGSTGGTNVVMDENEIMARNNGSASVLNIQAKGGNLMLCNNEEGSVGIGISSDVFLPAGYLLAVDGAGVFEEVRVKLSDNWPDYVFEDEYDLKPIDELKSFIEKEGHLPNIPSAEEAEVEGILIGEMQRLMMEKIEELSLYLIQQHEEIQELKRELKIQKSKS